MTLKPIIEVYPAAAENLTRFAYWLAGAGVERGFLGPREVDRIWDRHIANCAVVEELIPENTTVFDIGSGAGLPGVVLAIVRPDIQVGLIEPLMRRSQFLEEVITNLGITDRVRVMRGRAEELKGQNAPVVTARAVAPLAKLLTWALPLTTKGGQILAMKGSSAATEIADAGQILKGRKAEILLCGQGVVDPQTTVVRVTT
jgi:16S rRNA (guanine527-N7)-methyltransferase